MSAIPEHDLREVVNRPAHTLPTLDLPTQGREETVARLRLLWNERRLLFRMVIWGVAVSTIIAFLIPKQYESTTRLMPPDNQSSSGMLMIAALASKMGAGTGTATGGLAGLAGDLLGLKSSGALFIGVLRSRTVQDDLINKFDLRKVYRERLYEKARQKLDSRTTLSEDRKSGIITVTVNDRDPQRAADLAHAYVTELNNVVVQLNTSSAHRERVFLEQRLAQVKQDLEVAEKDFSQFASNNATIDIKEQGRAMVNGAAILQGQLIAAESELEGLKQIYADSNVRIRSLKARITELRSQLDKLGGKDEIAADATDPQDTSLYPSIRKLPLLGVPYADLFRRTKVQEAVFEVLTQEYELAKVQEAKETPSIKVLDEARVPERKAFPPRLVIISVSTFLTLVFATFFILGRTRWAKIDSTDPGKALATEVFRSFNSAMPWAPPNGSRWQAVSHRAWVRLASNRNSSKEED